MDSDGGTDDDFVGEATIPLEAVYTEGSIPPTVYNVVKDEEYRRNNNNGHRTPLFDVLYYCINLACLS
uniref:Uncharacterized protein n=1 Tax=Zea mays TaxID=4577 RepID=A0A804NX70_MAIZE